MDVKTKPINVYEEAICFAADCFRAGYSESKVNELVTDGFKQFTPPNVQFVLSKASQRIANEFARDRKSVVALHVKRYNQDLKRIFDGTQQDLVEEDDDDDDYKKRKKKIDRLIEALEIMFAKEKVLQIHAKETQVRIYNKINAKVKTKKVMFDLSKLTLQQKVEFLTLINKSKKSSNELYSVILNDKPKEVTEDIEAEVIENINIKEIQNYNQLQAAELIEPKKDLKHVQDKLKKYLAQQAEKKFKKVGAKNLASGILDLTKKNPKIV